MIVPEWYLEAKKRGDSKELLEKQVADFCLKALKHQALRSGAPQPIHAEPELVTMTIEMYEFAIETQKRKE